MLEWIVSSAALCAVVIGLRYLLRGRIGLRLQYALWGLVLLRLLLPVSFGSSRLSLMNALPGEKELLPAEPAVYALPDTGTADPLPAEITAPASPGTLASTLRTEAQPAPAAPGRRGGAPPRSFPGFSRVREIGPPEVPDPALRAACPSGGDRFCGSRKR